MWRAYRGVHDVFTNLANAIEIWISLLQVTGLYGHHFLHCVHVCNGVCVMLIVVVVVVMVGSDVLHYN